VRYFGLKNMGKNNKRKTNKGDRSTPNKVKQKALEETFENLKFEDPYEVRIISSVKVLHRICL